MLKGKTALVTGSTSGIGQGIAEAFAARAAISFLTASATPTKSKQLRARHRRDARRAVRYDGADMSKGRRDRPR